MDLDLCFPWLYDSCRNAEFAHSLSIDYLADRRYFFNLSLEGVKNPLIEALCGQSYSGKNMGKSIILEILNVRKKSYLSFVKVHY